MMKRFLATVLAALVGLVCLPHPAGAATPNTYDDFSMRAVRSAGQYWSGAQVAGQWSWSPQSATESRIAWGDPAKWPPTYNEQFVRAGDWVVLNGWFDNGTFYKVQTTSEWRAGPDCMTGRTYLPTGGPQHYVLYATPSAAYCLYAEGTITEQSTSKVMHFVHQQLWGAPAACPASPYGLAATDCVSQRESWSDDIGTSFALKLDRTAWLARGQGMARRIVQTFPLVNGQPWTTDLKYFWRW